MNKPTDYKKVSIWLGILVVIMLFCCLCMCCFQFSYMVSQSNYATPPYSSIEPYPYPATDLPATVTPKPIIAPTTTTLSGRLACLPNKNTSGPITLECAYGLRLANGTYYAIDTTDIAPDEIFRFSTGTQVTVVGVVTPIEELSTNSWSKYDIKGVILATDIY